MRDVTVYEYQHGEGVRVVVGKHVVSAAAGIPTAIRAYSNMKQAYAGERGRVREMLVLMMPEI